MLPVHQDSNTDSSFKEGLDWISTLFLQHNQGVSYKNTLLCTRSNIKLNIKLYHSGYTCTIIITIVLAIRQCAATPAFPFLTCRPFDTWRPSKRQLSFGATFCFACRPSLPQMWDFCNGAASPFFCFSPIFFFLFPLWVTRDTIL